MKATDSSTFQPLESVAALRARMAGREAFVGAVRDAIENGRGFAAGKIGYSEQTLLYAQFRGGLDHPRQRRAAALLLREHALRRSGIFPDGGEMQGRYAAHLAESIAALDYLGLGLDPDSGPLELLVVNHHAWPVRFVEYRDQEPDRSLPADPGACYLEALRGKRLLLVSPFADLLRQRATRETFEAVWANTGKRWFEPSRVEAVEFPWAVAPDTWERFATVFDLVRAVEEEISRREFDVALIGAAGMNIPLAVSIKRMGGCAIALGGHLQALFGVIGKRWRVDPHWRRYLNPAWIDLPASLRPRGPDVYCDGDYW